jgi:hypothetical protein
MLSGECKGVEYLCGDPSEEATGGGRQAAGDAVTDDGVPR